MTYGFSPKTAQASRMNKDQFFNAESIKLLINVDCCLIDATPDIG